jgi:HD-GYP domain-containing protein (c-di-GMP phosphodiesterase class II)
MELSLLASGDGTEVIHHKLYSGSRWAIVPQEGWTALEHFTVLSGKLIYKSSDGNVILGPGDSFNVCPVMEHTLFEAETEVEFIYICSQPVFHYYSQLLKNMMDLAISVEEKDGYTAEHCNRIKDLSMRVGEKLNLSSDEMYTLNLASFLHDIGKTKVPIEILNNPSKLNDEEWEIMKRHTTWGREVLEGTGLPALVEAGKLVEQHHERYDGKGYPNQLRGNEISLTAAIITVVDAFDAMTTDRVYRKAMTVQGAFDEIQRNKGTMFNPKVVDAFFSTNLDD